MVEGLLLSFQSWWKHLMCLKQFGYALYTCTISSAQQHICLSVQLFGSNRLNDWTVFGFGKHRADEEQGWNVQHFKRWKESAYLNPRQKKQNNVLSINNLIAIIITLVDKVFRYEKLPNKAAAVHLQCLQIFVSWLSAYWLFQEWCNVLPKGKKEQMISVLFESLEMVALLLRVMWDHTYSVNQIWRRR